MPRGGTRARSCRSCRQLKIKCDIERTPSSICSSCQHRGIQCFLPSQAIGGRGMTTLSPHAHNRPLVPASNAPVKCNSSLEFTGWQSDETSFAISKSLSQPAISLPSSGNSSTSSETIFSNANLPQNALAVGGEVQQPISEGKDFDGLYLEAKTIKDLFAVYFHHYHQFLPTLNPETSPDGYFAQSPLLFWSILTIAARKYQKDPTLLSAILPRTSKLAILQIYSKHAGINVVRSVLLLLTWRLPATEHTDETRFILSGTLLDLAVRLGLHVSPAPNNSRDYSQPIVELSESEVRRRIELWNYCLVAYERTNCLSGCVRSHLASSVYSQRPSKCGDSSSLDDVSVQFKIQSIVAKANNALSEHGLDLNLSAEGRTIDILIRTYIDELNSVEADRTFSLSLLNRIYLQTARLMLLSTHLFKDLKTINRDDLSSLYAVACATTQEVLEFDNAYDLKSYGTAYLWWSLLLSITVLLRILKTDLSKRVHQQDGAELFLAGLSNFSLWSIAYGDKTARIADAFGKLWRSDKVFKQSDGSSNVRLRVRTRLAMSLVFDLMLWHQQEFGGPSHACVNADEKGGNSLHDHSSDSSQAMPDGELFNTFLFFPDWGFNTNDLLFASISDPLFVEPADATLHASVTVSE